MASETQTTADIVPDIWNEELCKLRNERQIIETEILRFQSMLRTNLRKQEGIGWLIRRKQEDSERGHE
jgi:hypothetical protein